MHRTGRLIAVWLVVGHLVLIENPLLFSFVVVTVGLRIRRMINHISAVLRVGASFSWHTDSLAVFEVLIDLVLDLLAQGAGRNQSRWY